MENVDAALEYARRGWAVLALHGVRDGTGQCTCGRGCSHPYKHPATPRGVRDATRDPDRIKAQFTDPNFNVGVAAGPISELAVLDADGEPGVAALLDLDPPPTLTVSTPGGGVHMYFALERNRTYGSPVRFRQHMDLRCEGSYVVAPPSRTDAGPYSVLLDHEVVSIDPWLSNLIEDSSLRRRAERSAQPFRLPDVIEEGTRRDTIFRYACLLRACGLDANKIRPQVYDAVRLRCVQPPKASHSFSTADADVLIEDVCKRYPAGEDSLGTFDEYTLMRRILAELDSTGPPCVVDRDDVWYYHEDVWSRLGVHGTAQFLHAWAGEVYLLKSGETRRFKPTRRLITEVYEHMKLARSDTGFFDDPPPSAGFENGALLEDGTVITLQPDLKLRWRHRFDFEPEAQCPRWSQFLEETFEGVPDPVERVMALQEFAGAVLLGTATSYQKSVILLGPGENGKSVILDVMSSLVPPGAVASVSPHDMETDSKRARLTEVGLNIVTEMPSRELYRSEALKAIIDGSPITARWLYGQPFEARCTAAHMFAANILPDTNDHTHAFQRRWIILETPNKVPAQKRIPDLGKIIVQEEIAGIAAWAARGAQRLFRKQEYTAVPSSSAQIDEWRTDTDKVALYASQRLKDGTGVITSTRTIYEDFKIWRLENGYASMKISRFSRRLNALGWRKVKRSDGPYYLAELK